MQQGEVVIGMFQCSTMGAWVLERRKNQVSWCAKNAFLDTCTSKIWRTVSGCTLYVYIYIVLYLLYMSVCVTYVYLKLMWSAGS